MTIKKKYAKIDTAKEEPNMSILLQQGKWHTKEDLTKFIDQLEVQDVKQPHPLWKVIRWLVRQP